MKKLIPKLLILFIIFYLVSICIFLGLDFMAKSVYTGENGGFQNYIINNEFDYLLMGSSRTRKHLDRKTIFPDKNSANAGVNGQTFYHHGLLINCLLQNYTPKQIILNIDFSDIFIIESQEPKSSVNLFLPFINNPYVFEKVKKFNSTLFACLIKFYHLSRYTYRFRFLSIIENYFIDKSKPDIDYDPQDKIMDEHYKKNIKPLDFLGIDKDKIQVLREIIIICQKKDIKLKFSQVK